MLFRSYNNNIYNFASFMFSDIHIFILRVTLDIFKVYFGLLKEILSTTLPTDRTFYILLQKIINKQKEKKIKKY